MTKPVNGAKKKPKNWTKPKISVYLSTRTKLDVRIVLIVEGNDSMFTPPRYITIICSRHPGT